MLHIIPSFAVDKPEVLNLLNRAGVTFVDVDKLYKLWPHVSTGAIVVAAIPASQLGILQRYMSTLLPEIPSVVIGVPGAHYSAEWNILAATLPPEDWSVLEGKLAKSGLLASTAAQAEERGRSHVTEPLAVRKSAMPELLSRFVSDETSDDEDLPDGEDV